VPAAPAPTRFVLPVAGYATSPRYLIFVLAGHVAIRRGTSSPVTVLSGRTAGSRNICDAIPEHADREMISRAKRQADRIDDKAVFSCQENLIIDTSY
jgi:hypothetical protein